MYKRQKKLYLIEADGREGCRFHPANFAHQLEGCIAVGRKVARFPNGLWGITNSRTSLAEFMDGMDGREFTLSIIHMGIPML